MVYRIRITEKCIKQLNKIDKYQKNIILKWLKENLDNCQDPKDVKSYKTMFGKHKGKFRYRIGNYRVICKKEQNEFLILVLEAEHRSKIY